MQEAKARLSELVERAEVDGPQDIRLHGRRGSAESGPGIAVHWYKCSCRVYRRENATNEFVHEHEDCIHGVLSCFDRMLFRGYLPIMSGRSMAQRLEAHEIDSTSVKPLLLASTEPVKAHAVAMARERGRPFEYLSSKLRLARTAVRAVGDRV